MTCSCEYQTYRISDLKREKCIFSFGAVCLLVWCGLWGAVYNRFELWHLMEMLTKNFHNNISMKNLNLCCLLAHCKITPFYEKFVFNANVQIWFIQILSRILCSSSSGEEKYSVPWLSVACLRRTHGGRFNKIMEKAWQACFFWKRNSPLW